MEEANRPEGSGNYLQYSPERMKGKMRGKVKSGGSNLGIWAALQNDLFKQNISFNMVMLAISENRYFV